eukprot:scaffold138039_cov21-Tisochrysis_lutea.AAC.1
MGGPLWSIAYVIHNQRAIVNGSLQWIQLDGPCFCACTMLHAVFVHHLVSCAHWLISQQTYRTCKPAQGKQRCKCRALTARYDRVLSRALADLLTAFCVSMWRQQLCSGPRQPAVLTSACALIQVQTEGKR